MQVFDTPDKIRFFQLVAQRGAVKLEALGMRRSRGRSATAMLKEHYHVKTRTQVLECLEAEIAQYKEQHPNV